jgi:hypothetical protein
MLNSFDTQMRYWMNLWILSGILIGAQQLTLIWR